MRIVSDEMTEAWLSEDKTGPRRPVVRATIQRFALRQHRYDTADMLGPDGIARGTDYAYELKVRGYMSSAFFGDQGGIREISNIRKCDWSRSVKQDLAECTLTLLNTELVPIGTDAPAGHEGDFDQPGAMTPSRGSVSTEGNRWGLGDSGGWNGMVVPDRMIKTYEGYGSNPEVYPAQDEHLKQSGVWIIDDVSYSANGDIEVKSRDAGRLLVDQIVFPPAIPDPVYPLQFSAVKLVKAYSRKLSGGAWKGITGATVQSSNKYFRGQGIETSDGTEYISADGSVLGHRETDALDHGDGEHWISTGLEDTRQHVWWQADFAPKNIAGLRMYPIYGPYRVYISLKDQNGRWIGKRKLPKQKVRLRKPLPATPGESLTYPEIDMHTDIHYSRSFVVGGTYMADGGGEADHGYEFISNTPDMMEIGFRSVHKKVTGIRLTFKRLQSFPYDTIHSRRAAMEGIEIYTGEAKKLHTQRITTKRERGNYRDWSDVVRWMLAWGGWFWPEAGTTENFWPVAPTTYNYVEALEPDPVLPRGALWADIMTAGTGGVADLTVEMFDKRPFFDIIAEVRDTLGFLAHVDETGGFVFRMPNVWKLGNYLAPDDLNARGRSRTSDYVTIDERQTLLDYKITLSSRNTRERVFVGDATGHLGWAVKGYNPYGTNLRRVAGWTDKELKTQDEARIAADLIVTKQMFAYRQGQVTIPGYPAIQIDDQVKLYERTTQEMFFHYVAGISSSLDMLNGTWTYQLTTHWLGEDADGNGEWAVHPDKLDEATKEYLKAMGAL